MLHQLTKFQYQTYFFSREIEQCVFKFLLIQLMTSQTLRFIFGHLLQVNRWKRRSRELGQEKKKVKKFEYLDNEKRFLDEMKKIFHNLLRAIIW